MYTATEPGSLCTLLQNLGVCVHCYRTWESVYTATEPGSLCTLLQNLGVCVHCYRTWEFVYTATEPESLCTLLQNLGVCVHCYRTWESVYTATEPGSLCTLLHDLGVFVHCYMIVNSTLLYDWHYVLSLQSKYFTVSKHPRGEHFLFSYFHLSTNSHVLNVLVLCRAKCHFHTLCLPRQ